MKRVAKKLRSRRGETLVEILVAILIIALSAGLFATMYTASMRIDLTAREQDEAFFAAVGELEEMIDAGEGEGTKGAVQYQPTGEDGQPSSGSTSTSENVELFTRDGMTAYTGGK